KAAVAAERLPLCHGGCDRGSWLPDDGKVFSNVQREKIISRFLKESVLKRVFRAKQGPGCQKEERSPSFPGARNNKSLIHGTFFLRDFKKSPMETGLSLTSSSIRLFSLNGSLSASADRLAAPAPRLQVPQLCWPYADWDFFRDRTEPHLALFAPDDDGSSDLFSLPGWDFKFGNSSVQETLTDDSDLSESERANDAFLSYFKKMDLNLKPEAIETVEEAFRGEPSGVFPYPDFLPPPFNTLDLHKLALCRSDSWRGAVEPADSSVDRLLSRLLEMERLQHLTVQKERPRLPSTLCSPALSDRPPSSRALARGRPPKPSECLSLQTSGVDKNREKRKNVSGPCRLEQGVAKWTWGSAGRYKWGSRTPALKGPPSAKQLIASCDDFQSPRAWLLTPCPELPAKPAAAPMAPALVKMVSARCLPSRSPAPASPLPLALPESQREESKACRTKKKLCRKSIALSRPFCIRKLNGVSPSLAAKDKGAAADQK
ncbi:Protein FAM217A, partial [Galemys pyrenaicus]